MREIRRTYVKRGTVSDGSFMEGDRVVVRLSAEDYGVGFIIAKPTLKDENFRVDMGDGRVVAAHWFSIWHAGGDVLKPKHATNTKIIRPALLATKKVTNGK